MTKQTHIVSVEHRQLFSPEKALYYYSARTQTPVGAVWKVKEHLRKIHKIDDIDIIEVGFARPKYGFVRRIKDA
jgi:hypothetical protein